MPHYPLHVPQGLTVTTRRRQGNEPANRRRSIGGLITLCRYLLAARGDWPRADTRGSRIARVSRQSKISTRQTRKAAQTHLSVDGHFAKNPGSGLDLRLCRDTTFQVCTCGGETTSPSGLTDNAGRPQPSEKRANTVSNSIRPRRAMTRPESHSGWPCRCTKPCRHCIIFEVVLPVASALLTRLIPSAKRARDRSTPRAVRG